MHTVLGLMYVEIARIVHETCLCAHCHGPICFDCAVFSKNIMYINTFLFIRCVPRKSYEMLGMLSFKKD